MPQEARVRVLQYATYGGPEVLHVAERSMPEPRPGDVVIRVHASSVGVGDCKTRAGLLRNFHRVTFPKIPGRYGAGTITAVGAQAGAHRIGDAVVFATLHTDDGSAAEHVRVAADKIALSPRNLDHIETAAMIQPGTCATACLIVVGCVTAGEKVLIHGAAGGIGSACVELARHLGASIAATCRDGDRDFVRALGADRVIAFDREDFANMVRDQDVVVDLLGGEVHRRSYGALKRGGRLVYLNAAPFENLGARFGVDVRHAKIDDRGTLLDTVCRLAEQGVFRPRIGRVLPLAGGAEAHRLVESGAVKRDRVVIEP